MRARWATPLWLAAAATLVAASLVPAAAGHGLITLNVQVPPTGDCPADRARCLDSVEPQPPLHAGDRVDLLVWNDDDEPHRVLVAPNDSADPAREDTPAEVALASADVPANASRDAGELAIPAGTDVLYVWCDRPGHEADGAWMRVPVEPAAGEENGSPQGAGSLVAAVLAATGIAVTRRPGRGDR